jgi:hypothetical protein
MQATSWTFKWVVGWRKNAYYYYYRETEEGWGPDGTRVKNKKYQETRCETSLVAMKDEKNERGATLFPTFHLCMTSVGS